MANEGTWEVLPSNFTSSIGSRPINNSPETPVGDPLDPDSSGFYYVSRATQLVSEYLYIMKEQLVAAGWTVVSSSALIQHKYPGTDIRGFVSSSNFGGRPRQEWDVLFEAGPGDKWLPKYGEKYQVAGMPGPDTATWDSTAGSDFNPAWSVIYPGYVPVNTGSFPDSKGVVSGRIANFNSPGAGEDNAIGRSWILLRAPEDFREPLEKNNGIGRNYHMLLDYVHKDVPHIFASPRPNTYSVWIPNDTPGQPGNNDYNDEFGSFINILIFPNYNPGDSFTDIDPNGTYIPRPIQRPSHTEEIGCVVRSTNTNYGGRYFKIARVSRTSETENDTNSKYFVNTIYDKDNGSTIMLGSISGVPSFSIICGTLADPIPEEIIQQNDGNNESRAGIRFFNFWSVIDRKANLNPIKNLVSTIKSEYAVGLDKTIFDSMEDFVSTYGYSRYRPDVIGGGKKFIARQMCTCAPMFFCRTAGGAQIKKGPQILLSTSNFSKATTEYTYMEWPLPVISVQGNADNFTYHGRMMDIKLGHASMPNGLLAKESITSINYDRISFGGLWFPYNSPDSLLF